jgi:AcrR family transcriptional regulator
MNVKEGSDRNRARSDATRSELVAAARALFAERGFAGVGTEEIVRRAGVTRGALYHHFRNKEDLFLAAYEEIERELMERIGAAASGSVNSPWSALEAGAGLFLDACVEPEIQRIVLIDGPSVLGWDTWREVAGRYGLGLVEGVLQAAMDAGELEPGPVRTLAHMLMGAVDELALLVARAPDQAVARAEARAALARMLTALRGSRPG